MKKTIPEPRRYRDGIADEKPCLKGGWDDSLLPRMAALLEELRNSYPVVFSESKSPEMRELCARVDAILERQERQTDEELESGRFT